MSDPAIERKLKRWMPKIIDRSQRALNSLMREEWMLQLLNDLGDWAERVKKITVDEELGMTIQEIFTARIYAKLYTIKNPNGVPWSMCVSKWCRVVAARKCEDVRKRNARFVAERDVEVSSLVSTLPSPEAQLERKEQAPMRKRLKSKIPAAASRARAAADQQQIVSLWIDGDTLKRIAKKTGIPLSTVQKKLKKIQRCIVEGIGQEITEETGEAIPETSWLMKVLQKAVEDRGQLGQLLANRPRGVRRRPPRPRV
jgi:hypothetical protein